MVVLRLKRLGRTHRPFYRLNAMDQRSLRDGRVIEELGWFDPIAAEDKQLNLKNDRIEYWLSVGAQPSDTVRGLLKRVGVAVKPSRRAAAAAAKSA
jgi:small subunit ribosomal protein S16